MTGDGLELVRLFFNLLPQRQRWADKVSGCMFAAQNESWACLGSLTAEGHSHAQVNDAVEFIIDETFQVAGVGVVVAGTVKRGTLVQGASLLLGPHAGDASFKLTAIKSIAYKRLPVTRVRVAILSRRNCFVMWHRNLGGLQVA